MPTKAIMSPPKQAVLSSIQHQKASTALKRNRVLDQPVGSLMTGMPTVATLETVGAVDENTD